MLAHLASSFPRRAVPSVPRAISVQVPTSPRARSRALTVSAVRQSILHGSKEAKEDGDHEIQQHSRLVARGKYIHGIESTSHVYEKRSIRLPKSCRSQLIESSRTVSRSIRKPRRSISCVIMNAESVYCFNVANDTTLACGTTRNFGLSSRVISRLSLGSKIPFARTFVLHYRYMLTFPRPRLGVREPFRLGQCMEEDSGLRGSPRVS